MFDGKAFGEEVVGFVRTFVESELAPLKAENAELKERLAALEAVKMPDVLKGDPGEPGQNGADGKDGSDGRDGRGIKDLLIDRDGNLVATMDDGEMKNLGPVCGRDGNDGEKGADGRDGFSLDAFDVEKGEDGRTFVLKFEQGDVRHEYELTFPVPVYCGVFKEGESYVPGDMTTWGGSLWHCNEPTTEKPDTKGAAWTVACRKGRDGKDAKPNG